MEISYTSIRDHDCSDQMLLHYKGLLCQMSDSIDASITADHMRAKLNRILADDHYQIYLAVDDQHIVGTCTVLLEETFLHNCSLNAHVENLVVDKAYRGQGIAQKLVYLCVDHAHQAGAYKIILNCVPDLEALYRKCGFEKRGIQMRIDLDH